MGAALGVAAPPAGAGVLAAGGVVPEGFAVPAAAGVAAPLGVGRLATGAFAGGGAGIWIVTLGNC